MYRTITIDKKDYKFEYTIEAALYKDGIDRLIEFIGGTFGAQSGKEIADQLEDKEDREKVMEKMIENLKNEITNLPNTALTCFYMGFLEHHGPEGDSSISSMRDAKRLIGRFFEEQPEDGVKDFASLLAMCIDQMSEDGFFKTIGLEKVLGQNTEEKPNRAARRASTKQSGTKS